MTEHKFTDHSKRLQETAETIADLSFYCDAIPGTAYRFTYSSGSYDGGYIQDTRARIEVFRTLRKCKYCGYSELDSPTPEQRKCRKHCYITDTRTIFSWTQGNQTMKDAVNEFIGEQI